MIDDDAYRDVVFNHSCQDMSEIPDGSVQCVVTSPPYWGLRDYGIEPEIWGDGWEGVLGLEPTPDMYVEHMVAIFREVRRVLRKDGVAWLNLGDSYFNRTKKSGGAWHFDSGTLGIKIKDLVGIPWRVALALQADGWWLRDEIIWQKPNPMPSSVRDRTTRCHEQIFLLTKNARYYYDPVAISEPAKHSGRVIKYDESSKNYGHENRTYPGSDSMDTRNKRSVWSVTTNPYSGAHYATFPPDLIEPCIKAGTSERGACAECGGPMKRVVHNERRYDHVTTSGGKSKDGPYASQTGDGKGTHDIRHGVYLRNKTSRWEPNCDHEAGVVPCIVLDPFMGSGTTAMVAKSLGRDYVGFEVNPAYIKEHITPRLEKWDGQTRLGV